MQEHIRTQDISKPDASRGNGGKRSTKLGSKAKAAAEPSCSRRWVRSKEQLQVLAEHAE